MDWITLVLFALVVLISGPSLLRQYRALMKYKLLLDKFPGPKPYPVIGSCPEYMVSRECLYSVFDERFQKYGGLIRVWNLTYIEADVFLSKPEFLEIVLASTKHITKSKSYDRMQSWLGTGLLTGTGSKWHLHRKLITPAFHFKILEDFFEVFVEKSNILVTTLSQLPADTVVNLMPIISRCMLDIICETAMGANMNIQTDNKHDYYVTSVYELAELVVFREFRPWLYPEVIFYNTAEGKRYLACLRVLHGFTEKVIQERKCLRLNCIEAEKGNKMDDSPAGSKRRLALLDLLLGTCESDHPFTDLEIREEVDTFMFEGHDTTSMSLIFTLYLLGRHPDVQDTVAEELDQIFGGSHRNPTMQDLVDMKYLERVVKESLRLYPSVPYIGRRSEEDLPLCEGYTIPAHTNIILDIYHAHREPSQFPDPYTFNPDNFLPELTRRRHPYAYIPFSAGPRNCIGQKFALMEEKTVLSSILRNFRVEAVEENMIVLQELTLKPVNGLLVKLTPRKG